MIELNRLEYRYVWPKDLNHNATVSFARTKEGFAFEACKFSGVHNIYTIDDWEFLYALSAEILELERNNWAEMEGNEWERVVKLRLDKKQSEKK